MTVNYTTNLALGLPVTGTESGTWGDDVNNALTAYLDISIAGGLAIPISTADVTLALTTGNNSATGIISTGASGSTAQYATLIISGTKTAARNLNVPASSRNYLINNSAAAGGFLLTVRGLTLPSTYTTGITLADGEKAFISWNGTDYVKVATLGGTGALPLPTGTTAQQPASPVTGTVRYNTTSNEFEGYSGASPAWKSIGGSALSNDTSTASDLYPVFAAATSGTAQNLYTGNAKLLYKPSSGDLSATAHISTNGITLNANTIATSYTIAATNNGLSAGPVSVNSGVTVTVSTGSTWTVI
jgi:hypothetical protein